MRFLPVSLLALALAAAASGQQTPAAKTKAAPPAATKAKPVHPAVHPPASSAKTGTAKASSPKSAASKGSASKTNTKAASKTGTKSRRTVVARRPPTQQQPTADRYKEIQQALADKGYFPGPVDGAWSGGSVDALKRFQKDQNLDPDGKIGALSLIALGLGPKRGEAQAQAAPVGGERLDTPPVLQPRQ